jgi:methyl-accepting chemotaxis protein
MNSFEQQHRIRANRFLLIVLLLHVPVFTLLAAFGVGSVKAALLGSLALCAGPALLVSLNPVSLGASLAIAAATMGQSALLIFLTSGKIESHFHIFSFLAVLSYIASEWVLITAAAIIALHHLLGWWLLPSAVFNYAAGFSDVAVHALFVVVETIICCLIARQFAATIRMRGILEEQVDLTAGQVAMGSREIAGFVEHFAQSAATQASMVDQIAEASDRMRREVSANAASATETEENISRTVAEIAAANEKLERVNQEMKQVSEMSRKISGIVNLMMDIARQTNILAVNASIEASRSGNSGGGFGVIADQVRDLAVRTSEATSEIDTLIANSVKRVESSAQNIDQVAGKFAELNQATHQMKTLVEKVNASSRTQARGIEQISQSMQRISAETQNFASAAEETAGTSNQMSELAAQLRQTLLEMRA